MICANSTYFQELDTYFAEQLAPELGTELFVHIAQHRRRTVYPPENTWSALSPNKRGYKMQPHFQLGIWGDYVLCGCHSLIILKMKSRLRKPF